MDDKKWFESKKFLALAVVLAVILIIAIAGFAFHQQITDLVGKIITFASSHQIAQGAQDAIAKWKGAIPPAAPVVTPPAEEEVDVAAFDSKDFDPEAFV